MRHLAFPSSQDWKLSALHLCLSAMICGLCINQRFVQLLVYESGSGTIWDLSFEIEELT